MSAFVRLCHTAIVTHGPLLTTLFSAGLVGGVTHCAGMCGPFVLSQTATLLDDTPLETFSRFERLRGAALLPYQAGRLTTYTFLAVMATFLAEPLRNFPWLSWLSAALLAFAGAIFFFSAFPNLWPGFLSLPVSFSQHDSGLFRFLFIKPRGWRGYLLGVGLGFLPCGLVYAAILSVASRGDPLTAALGMVVFWLGTALVLVAVGVGGVFALPRFRSQLRTVFLVLMTINSLALFAMAGELIR